MPHAVRALGRARAEVHGGHGFAIIVQRIQAEARHAHLLLGVTGIFIRLSREVHGQEDDVVGFQFGGLVVREVRKTFAVRSHAAVGAGIKLPRAVCGAALITGFVNALNGDLVDAVLRAVRGGQVEVIPVGRQRP